MGTSGKQLENKYRRDIAEAIKALGHVANHSTKAIVKMVNRNVGTRIQVLNKIFPDHDFSVSEFAATKGQ